jgi:hypothetical protein
MMDSYDQGRTVGRSTSIPRQKWSLLRGVGSAGIGFDVFGGLGDLCLKESEEKTTA